MLTANRERFNLILNNILCYHPEALVIIDQKRDTKIIRVGKKAVAITNDEINKTGKIGNMNPFGLRLVKAVKNCFANYLKEHVDELIIDPITGQYTFPAIPRLNSSVYTNHKLFEELAIGEIVYLIDLKHAYWRIAYNKGYISEGLYLSHITGKESKRYRNMALACMLAPVKRIYYENGQPVREIEEVCQPYATMYANIRHACYNAVGDVYRAIPGMVLSIRTDGVLVLPDGLELAKKILYNRGYLCHIVRYCKLDHENLIDDQGNKKKF